MKWLRQEGRRNFEEGLELSIDFANRRFTFENFFNHPMGGAGHPRTFAFADADGEQFRQIVEQFAAGDLDRIFGAGAAAEFARILQMSEEQYAAENLADKQVVIDLATDY